MSLEEEEEVIGVSGSKAHHDEIQVINSGVKRYRCTKCLKNVHCIAGYNKREETPSMLKDRCASKDCECICRTHYMGRDGRMRMYGVIDNSFENENWSPDKRTKSDDIIDKINLQYRNKV